jgi:hypothetical protein
VRYEVGVKEPYQRPILSRYSDPVELIWLATARRLQLTIRRNPEIFSATDGTGLLELGPRSDLDPDDTLGQMVLHELCHWITNGEETYHTRDWGFPLDMKEDDPREFACLRLQAWLTRPFGLRVVMAPTSDFRGYYDRIPEDPLVPLDDSLMEQEVVRIAAQAVERAQQPPFCGPIRAALEATQQVGRCVSAFLDDYASEVAGDTLPSLWSIQE